MAQWTKVVGSRLINTMFYPNKRLKFFFLRNILKLNLKNHMEYKLTRPASDFDLAEGRTRGAGPSVSGEGVCRVTIQIITIG